MNNEDQFIPHLIVSDGMAALKFYKEVFGAEEGHNMMAPDGKRLMHGELMLDGHKLFVSDEFRPEEGGSCKTPQTLGGTSVRITLMTDDPDAVVVVGAASVGQAELARRALKQPRVQPLFEVRDFAADGRLRHSELLGRGGKASGADHAREHRDFV